MIIMRLRLRLWMYLAVLLCKLLGIKSQTSKIVEVRGPQKSVLMVFCSPLPSCCSESVPFLHHSQLGMCRFQVLLTAGPESLASNIEVLWNM